MGRQKYIENTDEEPFGKCSLGKLTRRWKDNSGWVRGSRSGSELDWTGQFRVLSLMVLKFGVSYAQN